MGDEIQKAPFNLALNTLERLGDILKDIKIVNASPYLTAPQKQASTIELTKSFYEQASPLLNKDDVEKFEWIFTKLEPTLVKTVKPNTSGFSYEQIHDPELNIKMSLARRDIAIALQKAGYFMPTKEESLF